MDITDKELPPLSYMEGIDLITEGILTLSKVERLLTQGVPEKSQGPANDLVNLIQNSDKPPLSSVPGSMWHIRIPTYP